MAKFRAAGKKKAATKRPGGAISCAILIVMGIILMSLLFYAMLESSG